MSEAQPLSQRSPIYLAATAVMLVVWFLLYRQLDTFAGWAVSWLPPTTDAHLKASLRFFIYDTPKVLLLLTLVVFAMGVARSYFSPERTRALLAGKREGLGNAAAAGLGVFTPFCSCSAVPLFVGFVSAGVPLGVTFSFLIAAPMVNEVALGLLFALLGWKIALSYLLLGLAIAIAAGFIIGRLKLEHWLEGWVRDVRAAPTTIADASRTMADRIVAGLEAVKDIVGRVWPWIIAGIAAGAFIHGYVPAAVFIGIPMYSNAAGIIPVVEALLAKGAALGTVLAFMMSVIGLSLPELIILRKVLTLPLIVVFASVVACGILLVGFAFNLIF